MNLWLIAARAVYFIALLQLFGLLVFRGFVLAPGTRRVPAWLILVTLAAMVAWLLLTAGAISGEGIREAIGDGTLATLLSRTQFGALWLARLAALAGTGIALLGRGRTPRFAAASAAGLALALTSASGHAGAETGLGDDFHLAADILHLLATGVWLGGLLPFASAMSRPASLAEADDAARRFSRLGLICVCTILATGATNSWFLVGNIAALIGTIYGHLLLIKIALFLAMVSLAAINRYRLTPLLREPGSKVLQALRRNSLIETALGLIILIVVAALGTLPPAYYAMP